MLINNIIGKQKIKLMARKVHVKNVWGVCVFEKTQQLNQFLAKWANPIETTRWKYSRKMYR